MDVLSLMSWGEINWLNLFEFQIHEVGTFEFLIPSKSIKYIGFVVREIRLSSFFNLLMKGREDMSWLFLTNASSMDNGYIVRLQ